MLLQSLTIPQVQEPPAVRTEASPAQVRSYLPARCAAVGVCARGAGLLARLCGLPAYARDMDQGGQAGAPRRGAIQDRQGETQVGQGRWCA